MILDKVIKSFKAFSRILQKWTNDNECRLVFVNVLSCFIIIDLFLYCCVNMLMLLIVVLIKYELNENVIKIFA